MKITVEFELHDDDILHALSLYDWWSHAELNDDGTFTVGDDEQKHVRVTKEMLSQAANLGVLNHFGLAQAVEGNEHYVDTLIQLAVYGEEKYA